MVNEEGSRMDRKKERKSAGGVMGNELGGGEQSE